MRNFSFFARGAGRTAALAGALMLVLAAGCRKQVPVAPTDQQITSDVQTKLGGEPALQGQQIDVAVANGVVTLSGTVRSDSVRALAGTESGSINGVKTVVNNLTVQPAPVAAIPPVPAPMLAAKATPAAKPTARKERTEKAPGTPPPTPLMAPAPQPVVAETHSTTLPPPPAPPKPVVKQVTLAAGTVIPVRITETVDSKTAQTNDAFHGALAGDLMADGVVAIPHGAPVTGRIVDAREAAHFKGSAELSLELTQMTVRGQRLTLTTDTYSQQGAGRGKNTAAKTGGGAAFGTIIGALA
ncbi:MAG: BON domain-containing protein, partial [Terracidiphilus sp.]